MKIDALRVARWATKHAYVYERGRGVLWQKTHNESVRPSWRETLFLAETWADEVHFGLVRRSVTFPTLCRVVTWMDVGRGVRARPWTSGEN